MINTFLLFSWSITSRNFLTALVGFEEDEERSSPNPGIEQHGFFLSKLIDNKSSTTPTLTFNWKLKPELLQLSTMH
jgi:hypothetical protein